MRIAHFIQRYPPALGGAEAYFARLTRYCRDRGAQVTVFTTSALDLAAFWSRSAKSGCHGVETEAGIEVRRYPLWRFPGRKFLLKPLSLIPFPPLQCMTLPCNPIAFGMWRDAGRLTGFDVVHASSFPYGWPIACGLRLARRLGAPFFLTPFVHAGDWDNPKDRTRRGYTSPGLMHLAKNADRIFAQTQREKSLLLEEGLAESRIVLQGLGVDAAECTDGDRVLVRQEWGLDDGEVAIGHLANNSEEKGTVDLLRAAELAWRRGARFRVILAGPSMPNFERFWRSFVPHDRVRTLGPLSEEAKRDFFAGIDAFALPSRSDSFGLVLLEAWANGLPNVAYRAGGIAEVVRHEQDGLLVECGDVAALAAALTRIENERDLRRALGECGRERADREFRWEDKLRLVWENYEAVTTRQAGSREQIQHAGTER